MTTDAYQTLRQQYADQDHLGTKVLTILVRGGITVTDAEVINYTSDGHLVLQDAAHKNLAVVAAGRWVCAVRMISTPACVTPEPVPLIDSASTAA